MADETGEAMVGFVVEDDTPEGLPTIYVLDTISPDETAVRRSHTFSRAMRSKTRLSGGCRRIGISIANGIAGTDALPDRFDVPLRYLGDWHKQPGSMIQPSHGDHMTALSWLDDEESGMDFLLVPIVTVGHLPNIGETELTVNYINVPMENGRVMRVDWWYVHRDVRVFQPVHPKVVADEQLPQMMKYSWHVVDPDRLYYRNGFALENDGLLGETACFTNAMEKCRWNTAFSPSGKAVHSFSCLRRSTTIPKARHKPTRRPSLTDLDLMDPVETFHKLWAVARAN